MSTQRPSPIKIATLYIATYIYGIRDSYLQLKFDRKDCKVAASAEDSDEKHTTGIQSIKIASAAVDRYY